MRLVGKKKTLPTLHHLTFLMRLVGKKKTLPTLHHYITTSLNFSNEAGGQKKDFAHPTSLSSSILRV
jgi:hypothetical protein